MILLFIITAKWFKLQVIHTLPSKFSFAKNDWLITIHVHFKSRGIWFEYDKGNHSFLKKYVNNKAKK